MSLPEKGEQTKDRVGEGGGEAGTASMYPNRHSSITTG